MKYLYVFLILVSIFTMSICYFGDSKNSCIERYHVQIINMGSVMQEFNCYDYVGSDIYYEFFGCDGNDYTGRFPKINCKKIKK